MDASEKTKQKAKNDLDEMDAAASKLALAYKKSRLRRVLTQMGKNCVQNGKLGRQFAMASAWALALASS